MLITPITKQSPKTINTTAPLTGGGVLTGDLTLAISAASGSAAGSMSATHYTLVNNATDAGTAGAIVKRDASGNFAANVAQANLFQDVTYLSFRLENQDGANGLVLRDTGNLKWTSGANIGFSVDTRLRRTGAGALTLDDGAGGTAQITVHQANVNLIDDNFSAKFKLEGGINDKALSMANDFALLWKSGSNYGHPTDARLYRTSASTLTLDDGAGAAAGLIVTGNVILASSGTNTGTKLSADAAGNMLTITTGGGGQYGNVTVAAVYSGAGSGLFGSPNVLLDGNLAFGSGRQLTWGTTDVYNAAVDTRLRRTSASTLTLDDGAGGAANLDFAGGSLTHVGALGNASSHLFITSNYGSGFVVDLNSAFQVGYSLVNFLGSSVNMNNGGGSSGGTLKMDAGRIAGYTGTQYANNAAAVTGGLAVGTLYVTSTGEVRCVV